MAVNCAACSVSMATAEVTQRPYDGVLGNYHEDCAYMEYLINSGPVKVNTALLAELMQAKDKLNKKHLSITEPVPAAPLGATATSTAMGIGVYKYAVTFVDSEGETAPGSLLTISTTTANQSVHLTAIPTGPVATGTTPLTKARNLYRTAVGGTQLKLLGTLANNTATTYSDVVADVSLGANAPTVATYAIVDFP